MVCSGPADDVSKWNDISTALNVVCFIEFGGKKTLFSVFQYIIISLTSILFSP
jgi:hypothetical protein